MITALSDYLAQAVPELDIQFEKKTSLTDSLKLVGNDPSAAPDLFLFAHDKIGVFARNGDSGAGGARCWRKGRWIAFCP